MGRMSCLPFESGFLFTANSFAPAMYGAIWGGAFPPSSRLTTAVVEVNALPAEAEVGQPMAACKCEARSPDGPGPEDREKALIADSTCARET